MYTSIIIIPLGGLGERFSKLGYSVPKPLIQVFGKPILFWLLDNLDIERDQLVYIPYNNCLANYRFEDLLRNTYKNIDFKFLKLENNTDGAAHTLKIALEKLELNYDVPILSIDGDNFYSMNILDIWKKSNKNLIYHFNDTNESPIYSYILKNENNTVMEIIEKNKISNDACCGIYGFQSYKMLLKYCNEIIEKQIKDKNEYYISTVIKQMIQDSVSFKTFEVPIENYHCLGTPFLVRLFCNNYPKISSTNNKILIETKRYCFDLDNTLVTFPKIKDDYKTVEPIQKNINFVRYLKSFGHTIIIYTARRMKTHKSNIGKILADIGKITFDTLEKFNIPYDEIYFGKPQADFYIDDLAINAFSNLEKMTGFYNSIIEPRDFNHLEIKSINTFVKRSDDLSGEIYYYKNIPESVKDMFPVLINSDLENKWFEMEKIYGITISKLFLNEELTDTIFLNILNSIERLHNCLHCNTSDSIPMYANYSKKIKKRFEIFDYSIYPNYLKTYDDILKELDIYEKNKLTKPTVIHGDTVFTNIVINKYQKIKFIDMRGKLDTILTIYGDPLYDYSKIYQSLIGYDEILFETSVSNEYKANLIKLFFDFIKKVYNDDIIKYIKIITKSLLFSLIPLHKNEKNKCIEYYNLIDSVYLK